MDKIKILWKDIRVFDTQGVMDVMGGLLRNKVYNGKGDGELNDCSWLLNDEQFVRGAMIIAANVDSFSAFEKGFFSYFCGVMKEDGENLVRKENLRRIKQYRPDVYEQWLEKKT